MAAALLAAVMGAGTVAADAGTIGPERTQLPTTEEVEARFDSFFEREAANGPLARRELTLRRVSATRGGLFPRRRLVAAYGSPAMPATILGRFGVASAQRKVLRRTARYDGRRGKRAIPAFDLVAVLTTADPGPSGKHRVRAPAEVIERYISAARGIGGRLLLDIQPGHSTFLREARALRPWLRKPRVDLALDPEWLGEPGPGDGGVGAKQLNRVSRFLQRLVDRRGLPDKAMVVHQFRRSSVRGRRYVRNRRDVDVTLDFDGIGTASAKEYGYELYSRDHVFNGMMLFELLDTGLMSPGSVLALDPRPHFVAYQ